MLTARPALHISNRISRCTVQFVQLLSEAPLLWELLFQCKCNVTITKNKLCKTFKNKVFCTVFFVVQGFKISANEI